MSILNTHNYITGDIPDFADGGNLNQARLNQLLQGLADLDSKVPNKHHNLNNLDQYDDHVQYLNTVRHTGIDHTSLLGGRPSQVIKVVGTGGDYTTLHAVVAGLNGQAATIYLKSGTYTVDTGDTINLNNCNIMGLGSNPQATIITAADLEGNANLITCRSINNVCVRGRRYGHDIVADSIENCELGKYQYFDDAYAINIASSDGSDMRILNNQINGRVKLADFNNATCHIAGNTFMKWLIASPTKSMIEISGHGGFSVHANVFAVDGLGSAIAIKLSSFTGSCTIIGNKAAHQNMHDISLVNVSPSAYKGIVIMGNSAFSVTGDSNTNNKKWAITGNVIGHNINIGYVKECVISNNIGESSSSITVSGGDYVLAIGNITDGVNITATHKVVEHNLIHV